MNNLTVYMNDHLAGGVAALELLGHLIKRHKGKPLAQFLIALEQDIESDAAVLRRLIGETRAQESFFRKAAAWLSEKFARVKFIGAGDQRDELGLLQALETIELGIRGKQLLWRALATTNLAGVSDVDLGELEKRALDQQQRVEKERTQIARAAFQQ
jgi:hypothetical protein